MAYFRKHKNSLSPLIDGLTSGQVFFFFVCNTGYT